jgi:hypothetical protein
LIELLLTKLGNEAFVDHEESGRDISKGFLEEAKAIANTNVAILPHYFRKLL